MKRPEFSKIYGEIISPEALVFVLHGIKTDSGAVAPMAKAIADKNPNALVIVPEGPVKMQVRDKDEKWLRAHYPDFDPAKARGWFNLGKLPPLTSLFNLHVAKIGLNKLIDEQLALYGLSDDRLVLSGFSQGGSMALYTALSREKQCNAVIAHSSPFVGGVRIKSRPPVMMISGLEDKIVMDPCSKFPKHWDSVHRLRQSGVPVSDVRAFGLGHDFNTASLAYIAQQVQRTLTEQAQTAAIPARKSIPSGGALVPYRLIRS